MMQAHQDGYKRNRTRTKKCEAHIYLGTKKWGRPEKKKAKDLVNKSRCPFMTQRSIFSMNRIKFILDHKLLPRSPTMAFSSVRENVTPTPSWKCVENIIIYKIFYLIMFYFNFILFYYYN